MYLLDRDFGGITVRALRSAKNLIRHRVFCNAICSSRFIFSFNNSVKTPFALLSLNFVLTTYNRLLPGRPYAYTLKQASVASYAFFASSLLHSMRIRLSNLRIWQVQTYDINRSLIDFFITHIAPSHVTYVSIQSIIVSIVTHQSYRYQVPDGNLYCVIRGYSRHFLFFITRVQPPSAPFTIAPTVDEADDNARKKVSQYAIRPCRHVFIFAYP